MNFLSSFIVKKKSIKKKKQKEEKKKKNIANGLNMKEQIKPATKKPKIKGYPSLTTDIKAPLKLFYFEFNSIKLRYIIQILIYENLIFLFYI